MGHFFGGVGALFSGFNSKVKNLCYFQEAVILGAPLLSEFYGSCGYSLCQHNKGKTMSVTKKITEF